MNATASALERVACCPDSHALPHVHASSIYAERGHAIAGFVRAVIGGTPRAIAVASVREEWRHTCAGLDFGALVGDLSNVRGEMAYALNVITDEVRELGSNLGRRYPPLRAFEIAGSDDIEGERIDGVPVVVDIKSGLEVTHPSENYQLRFFGRVLQILRRAPVVEGRIAYVDDDGGVRLECAEWSTFDLESYGDELRDIVARVSESRARLEAGGRAVVSSGPHCKYCPAMPACPAYVALARSMLGDVTEIGERLAAMSPEDQGRAWVKAKEIERLLEPILDGLKAIARTNPIPLPTGQILREQKWTATSFDKARALAMLRERGVKEPEIAALTVKTPTTQMRATGKKRKELVA